jgi:hypothetical protein
VTGATEWHINADEPQLFDYNDTVKDAGEAEFERKSTALPLYAPDPYRSSDHDPVLVGLALATAPQADAGGPYAGRVGQPTTLDASGSTGTGTLTYAWDLDGDGAFDDAVGPQVSTAPRAPGSYVVAVEVTDREQRTSVDQAVLVVTTPGKGNGGTPPGRS